MIFRKALLATTMLMFPLAVEAQTASEPVTGPYVGAAGGFTIGVLKRRLATYGNPEFTTDGDKYIPVQPTPSASVS